MLLEVLSSNYPARHIGSTLVEQVRAGSITVPMRNWKVTRGTIGIQRRKHILSKVRIAMTGGFMICMVMCGSGAPIGTKKTILTAARAFKTRVKREFKYPRVKRYLRRLGETSVIESHSASRRATFFMLG